MGIVGRLSSRCRVLIFVHPGLQEHQQLIKRAIAGYASASPAAYPGFGSSICVELPRLIRPCNLVELGLYESLASTDRASRSPVASCAADSSVARMRRHDGRSGHRRPSPS